MSQEQTQTKVHSNLEPMEILPLALVAYPAYQLIVKYDDKKAFAAVVAASALMLDVAAGSPSFMGSGKEGSFNIKNFGLMEVAVLAAYGYAAYQLIKVHNDPLAAAALAGVIILGLVQSGKSDKDW